MRGVKTEETGESTIGENSVELSKRVEVVEGVAESGEYVKLSVLDCLRSKAEAGV